MMKKTLAEIQNFLQQLGLDGWLFFDHHHRDPLAYRILGLPATQTVTRRWFYLIPAHGEPRKLVHRIEPNVLQALPGDTLLYAGWRELEKGLEMLLRGVRNVAMQYSPRCALPIVSVVDAGTFELVSSKGVTIQSSADLVQLVEACWTEHQLQQHLEAGRRVDQARREVFEFIKQRYRYVELTEFEVKEFIRERFAQLNLVTDHGPIVAVNAHSADPHYEPEVGSSWPIRSNSVLLIDMWAKLNEPGSVYYDITWCGWCGEQVPERVAHVFTVVKKARDEAIGFVDGRLRSGEPVHGFEVDNVARNVIRDAGFEEYFVHRTGHSIGEDVHGAGANMDDYETHDTRRVLPGTCFSIEPGIYLSEFGIRLEVNVYAGPDGATVTGEKQDEILLL